MADSILVVDDDVALAKVLCALLAQAKFRASTVADASAALAVLEKGGVDLVLTDVRMPGLDGFGLLQAVRERWSDVPVVMMTAHGTVSMAVDAMKQGAADFLLKPFENDNLKYVVAKVLQGSGKDREAVPKAAGKKAGGGLLGSTPAMLEVKSLIERTAPSNATVLLRGENGTGKEVAARELHRLSKRAGGPFIAVNCGALPENLLEAELFGHEKGAFTGATGARAGRVELAEGGTLFLDEIGDMTPAMQVKLLRLLQEKEYDRVGGTTRKADVRFLAATNKPLEEMLKTGAFREDLFHRLTVVPIWLPPLRDRKADIAVLARLFLTNSASENGRANLSFDDGAIARLEGQSWSGNVRQLQNFIERLVVLSVADTITAADVDRELSRGPALPQTPGGASGGSTLTDQRKDAEKKAVEEALRQAKGNRTTAARLLNVSRRTLYNKLEELGIEQSPKP